MTAQKPENAQAQTQARKLAERPQKGDQKPSYTLVGRDGREYATTDRTEVVNLQARGYRLK